METPDILEVNSAITALIEDFSNTQAATTIITFAHKIPTTRPINFNCQVKIDRVFSHEGSNLVFENKGQWEEFSLGLPHLQVGCYKLWKPKKNIICFKEKWIFDPASIDKNQPHPEFAIVFHPENLQYKDFLLLEIDREYRIGRLCFGRELFRSLFDCRVKMSSFYIRPAK